MKSMSFGLASKPSYSYSKYSLVPPVAASCHGEVDFSRVHAIRTKQSYGRLNCQRSRQLNDAKNKHHTGFARQQERKAKFSANATSGFSDHHEHKFRGVGAEISGKSLGAMFDVIYRFSRVYTLKGMEHCFNVFARCREVYRLYSIVLPRSFAVGLNQLSDIEIDRVNKPDLPLASGELSVETGILIISLYATLGFCLGWITKSWPLKLSLFISYTIGSAYSVKLPFLRWKRFPVVVALSTTTFQGVILPMLYYFHAQTYIHGRTLLLSKHALFVLGIMSIYTTVFLLIKDIPDVEGDKLEGIKSFASILGPKRVFWISIWLLELAYGIAVLIGLSSTHLWIRLIMVTSHSILGFILWRKANLVNLKSKKAVQSFYMFIWKLYYAEYLLVPILRF